MLESVNLTCIHSFVHFFNVRFLGLVCRTTCCINGQTKISNRSFANCRQGNINWRRWMLYWQLCSLPVWSSDVPTTGSPSSTCVSVCFTQTPSCYFVNPLLRGLNQQNKHKTAKYNILVTFLNSFFFFHWNQCFKKALTIAFRATYLITDTAV